MKNAFYLLVFECHYRTQIAIIGEPHFYSFISVWKNMNSFKQNPLEDVIYIKFFYI